MFFGSDHAMIRRPDIVLVNFYFFLVTKSINEMFYINHYLHKVYKPIVYVLHEDDKCFCSV